MSSTTLQTELTLIQLLGFFSEAQGNPIYISIKGVERNLYELRLQFANNDQKQHSPLNSFSGTYPQARTLNILNQIGELKFPTVTIQIQNVHDYELTQKYWDLAQPQAIKTPVYSFGSIG